jgi:hypothetical protein
LHQPLTTPPVLPSELYRAIHSLLTVRGFAKAAKSLLKEAGIEAAAEEVQRLGDVKRVVEGWEAAKSEAESTSESSSSESEDDESSDSESESESEAADKEQAKVGKVVIEVVGESELSSIVGVRSIC